jgi:hypothetical protein
VGICFDPARRLQRLEILVDGVPHLASAFGMPRPDVAARYGGGALNSGFWATVPIARREHPGDVVIEVSARLRGGACARAELGRIEVVAPAAPGAPDPPARPARAPRPDRGLIAVCMASFDPDLTLLRGQLDSLRAQTDERWICLVSDDCSESATYRRIVELVGGDPRFAISRSPRRLGFYRNFERALSMVPVDAELIALSDQDDRWHTDKLQTLRASLGRSLLVYSDQRLVDADGTVLRDTLWRGRRNNHDNLASMLMANTITGAATLFARQLLDVLLPFPDTPGFQFHDAWLGAAALAAGEVTYVDRPLYDYVQHPRAVFGDVTHGAGTGGWSMAGTRRWVRGDRALASRAAYFHGYLAHQAAAQVLLARCADRLTPSKRRSLERIVACDRSAAALAWLTLRAARCAAGHTETLGAELGLARGIAWKQVTAATASRRPATHGPFSDASIPGPQHFNQKRLRRWRARL